MKAQHKIILVTSKLIYLFDTKFVKFTIEDIEQFDQIVLVKTNPTIFQMQLRSGLSSLLLQTFRRTELVVFLLTQRENRSLQTSLLRQETIFYKMADGTSTQMVFAKDMDGQSAHQKKIMKRT